MALAVNNVSSVFQNIDIQRQPTRAERIEANNQQIARIDREITARRNYIASNNDIIQNYKDLIASNEKLIQLHKEDIALRKEYVKNVTESRDLDLKQIEVLKESKELGNKKIARLQETNNQLLDLVEKSRRSRSASPEMITANAVQVSDNIKEANAKVSEVKQVAKSEGRELDISTRRQVAANALEEIAKNKQKKDAATQTEFTYSTRVPRGRTYQTEGLDIKPITNEFSSIRNLENKIYQSQKNLYESIIVAKL